MNCQWTQIQLPFRHYFFCKKKKKKKKSVKKKCEPCALEKIHELFLTFKIHVPFYSVEIFYSNFLHWNSGGTDCIRGKFYMPVLFLSGRKILEHSVFFFLFLGWRKNFLTGKKNCFQKVQHNNAHRKSDGMWMVVLISCKKTNKALNYKNHFQNLKISSW